MPITEELRNSLVKIFTWKKVSKDLKPEGAYLTREPYVYEHQIEEALELIHSYTETAVREARRDELRLLQNHNRRHNAKVCEPYYVAERLARLTQNTKENNHERS